MLNSLFYHFITSIYRKNNEVQKYQRPVIRKQQEIWNRPYVHMYILVCAYTRTIPWLWTWSPLTRRCKLSIIDSRWLIGVNQVFNLQQQTTDEIKNTQLK